MDTAGPAQRSISSSPQGQYRALVAQLLPLPDETLMRDVDEGGAFEAAGERTEERRVAAPEVIDDRDHPRLLGRGHRATHRPERGELCRITPLAIATAACGEPLEDYLGNLLRDSCEQFVRVLVQRPAKPPTAGRFRSGHGCFL